MITICVGESNGCFLEVRFKKPFNVTYSLIFFLVYISIIDKNIKKSIFKEPTMPACRNSLQLKGPLLIDTQDNKKPKRHWNGSLSACFYDLKQPVFHSSSFFSSEKGAILTTRGSQNSAVAPVNLLFCILGMKTDCNKFKPS